MSRIGNAPINIPAGVSVNFKDSTVSAEANGKTLTQKVSDGINVEISENVITLTRSSNSKDQRADHGLYRSLISNMLVGLSDGWSKKLELVGVGFRANHRGQVLDLALGFSHNISIQIPPEVKVNTISEKGKNPIVELSSYDKQLLGMVASKIRSFRKPEPYKGKGVRYLGEVVRKKAGKTAAK